MATSEPDKPIPDNPVPQSREVLDFISSREVEVPQLFRGKKIQKIWRAVPDDFATQTKLYVIFLAITVLAIGVRAAWEFLTWMVEQARHIESK